jgi:phenylalanine-4-hydroxylase
MAEATQSRSQLAREPRRASGIIAQDWRAYTQEEHDRWRRLYARQERLLPGRACDAFLEAKEKLELDRCCIPDFEELSERLSCLTGWRIAPVAGLVPDEVFFGCLADRRFPAAAFIRTEQELDYLSEPDVFHDVFGHVPLLADPVYAQFLEAYGRGGRRAMQRGQLQNLARLYWYTVEFGLIRSRDGLRIFGAGILSSPGETVFSLRDSSPNRIAFELCRVMRTKYVISDFQQSYFVIDSFRQLLDDCYQDFAAIYDRLRSQVDIEPHELLPEDRIITKGDMRYFKAGH